MFRSIFVISSLFSSSLFANQITIHATIAPHANTQMKMTQVNALSIKQDVYLQTNHKGLTISLSNSSYGTSTLMNYRPMTIAPMNFSNKIHTKPTKVGELIISQKENRGSLGITIAVK